MNRVDCKSDPDWLEMVTQSLRDIGFCIVENAIPATLLQQTPEKLYATQAKIQALIGRDRLQQAGELGVLRLMMQFEPFFTQYLEIPEFLQVIDATVSPTAIMHLQNGFILPSLPESHTPAVFQNQFHMDFRRLLNGYMASINLFIAISDFHATNGATLVVPGSHQKTEQPNRNYLQRHKIQIQCPAGSMVVFDSTLWHASGRNHSGRDRLSINHQFTRSWIKPQIDYVRALGPDFIQSLPPRTQQLLGWYTRVVTSLDEYYQPTEKRLYRAGQG